MKTNTLTPQEQLCALAAKYGVSVPEPWRLGFQTVENGISGWCIRSGNETIPLFPWRCERRFVELKRIVETKTLEDVVLCRFAHVTDGKTLDLGQILYREFDLLEGIVGEKIVSVSGSTYGECFSNVLVRLENGTIASVEAGTTLPDGSPTLDRHELIARRGVASDRVVDTHVPQQSVYLFAKDGVRSWTDTDAELFGLRQDEIDAVRAAFELAKTPKLAPDHVAQRERLVEWVACALKT